MKMSYESYEIKHFTEIQQNSWKNIELLLWQLH